MSSSHYNLRSKNPPSKAALTKKGKAPTNPSGSSGKGLSPMPPVANLKPKSVAPAISAAYPVNSSFGKKSTGARYLHAAQRDEGRVSAKSTGKPKHKFEKTARETRQKWSSGPKQLTPMQTPYGPVNLSKFPTGDPGPKITTVKKHYKNSSVGHKYTELGEALISPSLKAGARKSREQEVAAELLEAIETGSPPSAKRRKIAEGEESNAAAKFLAISHVSEPERVRGSSKDVRAALRGVKKGKRSFAAAFEGNANEPPRYLMAKNPNAARRALGIGKYKTPHPPSSFMATDSDYSDSSDDDS